MDWLDSNEKVIRGFTERQRDLLVVEFIHSREKKLEVWDIEEEWHTPSRTLNYKPWGARLRRL